MFRVDLDLTGDGRPELFVASSLGMYRGCPMWRLYHARKGGGYDPFLTKSEIKAGWTAERTLFSDFRFGLRLGRAKGKPAMAIPWHDRFADKEDEHWGELIVQFVGGHVVDLSQKFLDEQWGGEQLSGKEISIDDHIKGVMVVDLLRDPETPWRPIDVSQRVPCGESYFLDRADEERAKKLGAFTPTLAWKWLKLAKQGRTPSEAEKAVESLAPVEPEPTLEVSEKPAVSPQAIDLQATARSEPVQASPPAAEPAPSFWMELLRFSVRWRGVLSGGMTCLVAGLGVMRWWRLRG